MYVCIVISNNMNNYKYSKIYIFNIFIHIKKYFSIKHKNYVFNVFFIYVHILFEKSKTNFISFHNMLFLVMHLITLPLLW